MPVTRWMLAASLTLGLLAGPASPRAQPAPAPQSRPAANDGPSEAPTCQQVAATVRPIYVAHSKVTLKYLVPHQRPMVEARYAKTLSVKTLTDLCVRTGADEQSRRCLVTCKTMDDMLACQTAFARRQAVLRGAPAASPAAPVSAPVTKER